MPSALLARRGSMRAPAVFPALATIAGIACGVLAPTGRPSALAVLILSLGSAIAAWRSGRERLLGVSLVAGFFAAGAVFGAVAALNARQTPLRDFFDAYSAQPGSAWPLVIEGRLRGDAMPSELGASLTIDVERVRTPCGWVPTAGGVRLAVAGTLAMAALDSWREGRRIRVPATLRLPTAYRNPGAPDEEFALARRGVALVGSVKSGALVDVTARGDTLQEAAASARAYVRAAVRNAMPARPMAAGIVTAILIGDRGGLDAQTSRRLQEAGTYHVIAISGGNIAILAGLTFLMLRLLRVPRRAGALVLAVLLCGYGYIAGGGPSVARATLAAAVYLTAVGVDHRSPAANVLATVALMAVVYEPLQVFDPGLALSYGATVALLIGAQRVLGRQTRAAEGAAAQKHAERRGTLRTLCASASSASQAVFLGTVCAELALFPVGAYVFQRITLAGLILNFAAIPLMTLAQIAGLAVLLVSPMWSTVAEGLGVVSALGATGLTESTRLLEFAPWLTWRVPAPAWWIVAVYYAGWACRLWIPVPRRLEAGALGASLTAALVICTPALSRTALLPLHTGAQELRLTFLDVGQGDSVLVQFPGGTTMLIDAAGVPGSTFDLGERVITPALLSLGVGRLEYLAITHGDPDHVAGAESLVRDFRPRELWEGIAVPPHPMLRDLQHGVTLAGGALRTVRPDDRLRIGDVELRVLHPAEPDWERQRVRNDDSIVLELRYGDVSIVLPGDISTAIEEALAPKLSDAPIRVLKAAHHGSASSSSGAWLDAARAAAVVFSCGRGNRYGHPHPSVLERVRSRGSQVFRTDEDGAVTVTTDGEALTISGFTGRRLTTKATKATKEDTTDASA